MGHGKSDRPFLSAAEHSGVYGAHSASVGKQGGQQEAAFQSVPYDCCGISFQPWSNPVCSSRSGMVFELTNLIPFVRKFGVHPATGDDFDLNDVVALHFSKNDAGRYQDPVSFKEFGQHSHIVAVRTTGNVYLYETVQRLNIKSKNMKDLVTDEPFVKSDLIAIQDPNHPETRSPQTMHHVKEGLHLTQADKGIDNTELVNVRATGSASRLLTKLQGDAPRSAQSPSVPPSSTPTSSALSRNKATGASTGRTGASLTSSTITPRTAIDRVVLDDEEVMFEHLKAKGAKDGKAYVRLTTNFGPLNLELHCDKAPKTCYNFITLCKQGKYDDTIFHRNIPGFMIQGGDPTGTGRGGQSIWGTEFRDEYGNPGAFKHTSRGVLSMANKGPGTNSSQFFFTYRAVAHLDGKHTVFGRLVDGEKDSTLTKLEQVPSEQGTDKPLRTIRILDVLVTEDPFEKYQLKQQKAAKTHDADDQEQMRRLEKKRRRDADRTTWLGTELPSKSESQDADKSAAKLLQGTSSIGKYLAQSKPAPSIDQPTQKKHKATGNGGFGDFSSW